MGWWRRWASWTICQADFEAMPFLHGRSRSVLWTCCELSISLTRHDMMLTDASLMSLKGWIFDGGGRAKP